MKRNLLIALFPLSILSASAAVPTYNAGDVLVGFRALTGTGAGTNYVVNIGSAASFRDATAAITVSRGNIATDLASIFGANWATRTDLQWGILNSPSNVEEISGDPSFTTYFSQPENVAGTPVTTANPSLTTRRSGSTRLQGLQTGFAEESTAADGNAFAAIQDETAPKSWRQYMAAGGTYAQTADFGTIPEIEGIPSQSLSFFRMLPEANKPATYEGHFTLSSAGQLVFTPAASAPVSAYAAWATTNVNGQASNLDFDGDGLSNGLEYFMGTDPKVANINPVPVASGQVRTITWPRSSTAEVTSFLVQTSTDLVNWTTATPVATSTSLSLELPAGQSKVFARLVVDAQ